MKVLVLGHKGEVGSALYELVKSVHDVQGLDPKAPEETISLDTKFDVIHVAFPYGPDFFPMMRANVGNLAHRQFTATDPTTGISATSRPDTLIIIESTVPPGTTKKLTDYLERHFVHSPIRGLHTHMKRDLLRFVKYVGSYDSGFAARAVAYYKTLGIEARTMRSPLETECSKLFDLATYGTMIALHQAFYILCRNKGVSYWDAVMEDADTGRLGWEYKWPKPVFFPDVIGGHCVVPGIEMLAEADGDPSFWRSILEENEYLARFVKNDKFHFNEIAAMKRHIEISYPDW